MKILAIAYACDPSEGSEPGAGWMWSRMLARIGETTVITRANNRAAIEASLPTTRELDNLRFVYVDLPAWASFWKKGQRGIRLYYLLWQVLALRSARRIHRATPFDVVWHLTLASYWLGSVGGFVGPPFIFGPVGGGVPACLRGWLVGTRGVVYEVGRGFARAIYHRLNPLVKGAIGRADLILVNNLDTSVRLRAGSKVRVFPNVLIDPRGGSRRGAEAEQVAVYAGRLLPSKGVALAIRAMALLPDWKLRIFGKGPDEKRLRRLAEKLGVAHRVVFEGWVPRDHLHEVMATDASVFVFPSVHDNAPWVVGEATSLGLPVICLDRGGSPTIAAAPGVALGDSIATTRDFARAIAEARPSDSGNRWDTEIRERELRDILAEHGFAVVPEPG